MVEDYYFDGARPFSPELFFYYYYSPPPLLNILLQVVMAGQGISLCRRVVATWLADLLLEGHGCPCWLARQCCGQIFVALLCGFEMGEMR